MPQSAMLDDIVRTLGDRRVLDGVSVPASSGHRIGRIGENGVGKSTLLRLLAGTDEPDAGSVTRSPDLGFLQQETPYNNTDATIADVLDDALGEAREDLAELERLTELSRGPGRTRPSTPTCSTRTVAGSDRPRSGWHGTPTGVPRSCSKASASAPSGTTRRSGRCPAGQRGRLALAALLIRRPSALLLDEPTDHLDGAAAAFVEELVRTLPGIVVVASHDRAFLDAVCTDLIDLDPAMDGSVRYGGNYSAYLAARRAEREHSERRRSEEQMERAALEVSAAVTAYRLAPDRGPRDNEEMGYGHRADRVQSQISRRVRNAAA